MKYLTFFLSILISLISLEFFVRIFIDNGFNYEIEMMKYANKLKIISENKSIGIEHKKNAKGKFMGTVINLNSDGFRNNMNLKFDSKKILMLGDSMTLGWGANNPFPNALNDKISNYEVINAGIGNTNTIMQIENFFENFIEKYNYKIIILNFFINDFEKVEIKKPNILQKYSYLYTYISNNLNTVLIKFKIKKNWNRFYSETYTDIKIKNDTFNQILKLKNYCEKNDIKLIIHNIPELRNLNNYKFTQETNLIKDFALNNEIEFINSHSVLKNYNDSDLWVTKLDSHANDNAHEIISEFIYQKISKYLE